MSTSPDVGIVRKQFIGDFEAGQKAKMKERKTHLPKKRIGNQEKSVKKEHSFTASTAERNLREVANAQDQVGVTNTTETGMVGIDRCQSPDADPLDIGANTRITPGVPFRKAPKDRPVVLRREPEGSVLLSAAGCHEGSSRAMRKVVIENRKCVEVQD